MFNRTRYPDFTPPLTSPPEGCAKCPARRVCAHLQVEEEVLCELTDAEAGVDTDREVLDYWLEKVSETPPNQRGTSWDDEAAAD